MSNKRGSFLYSVYPQCHKYNEYESSPSNTSSLYENNLDTNESLKISRLAIAKHSIKAITPGKFEYSFKIKKQKIINNKLTIEIYCC